MVNEIRIVSDGTTAGTHVYDRDGRELLGVTKVAWSLDFKEGLAKAEITFVGVDVDVLADPDHVEYIAKVLIPRAPDEESA